MSSAARFWESITTGAWYRRGVWGTELRDDDSLQPAVHCSECARACTETQLKHTFLPLSHSRAGYLPFRSLSLFLSCSFSLSCLGWLIYFSTGFISCWVLLCVSVCVWFLSVSQSAQMQTNCSAALVWSHILTSCNVTYTYKY
ncbi:hypothetical protein SKAU_G00091340 [Synaphobranchus kaupii]|uniref:Uncharacterized protein n=1 Tax=Synaphobranchus kaupii TaxID=118154 RepID=A0A9Q1J6H3_SYNKA|nr:hypothetical protein SKAU_G00091340 [Synaphobranchus kaupii]